MAYYSQYRIKAYEQQNGLLHQKVGSWLRDVQAAYASDWPSPYRRRPALSARITSRTRTRSTAVTDTDCPRRQRQRRQSRQSSPPLTRIKNEDLYVLKGYKGLLPFVAMSHDAMRAVTRLLPVLYQEGAFSDSACTAFEIRRLPANLPTKNQNKGNNPNDPSHEQ